MVDNPSNGQKDKLILLLSNALNKSLDLSLHRAKRLLYFSVGFLTGLGFALPFLISMNAERNSLLTYRQSFRKSIQQINELKTEINQLSLLVDKEKAIEGKTNGVASIVVSTPAPVPPETQKVLVQTFEVFIHYKRSDYKEVLERLQQYLDEAVNLNVHDMDRVNLNFRKNEIRYFKEEDREGAKQILSRIHSFFLAHGSNGKVPVLEIKSFSENFPNAREGLVEIWIHSL